MQSLLKKGTKMYSIGKLKCPQCQEGNLFLTQSHYNLKKFDKMLDKCPVCNLYYQLEPGFFWGAMYVSYFGVILLSAALMFPIYFISKPPIFSLLIFNSLLIIIGSPMVFRYSRAVWINLFVGYNSDVTKNPA